MTAPWYTDFFGDTWEDMCNKLLSLKHGSFYQPISDINGDMGLDGLVLKDGIAYQAYGLEPENKDPAKGVKTKIHKDITKLKTNQEKILEVLGGKKITSWVLLLNKKIPCSSIHAYIANKKKELKEWKLPHVSDDVEVTVQEPSYLATEYLEYAKRKDGKINIDIDMPSAPEMAKLEQTDNFKKVFEKFKLIAPSEEAAKDLAYKELKNHIEKLIILEEIQMKETELYSAIEQIRSTVEEEAKEGSLLEGSFSSLSQTKNSLEIKLNNSIANNLDSLTLGRVREFLVADWFVRCPLSFKKKP